MKELKFTVSGQRVSKVGDFGTIRKGSKGYLKCTFAFNDPDWFGLHHICVFEYDSKEEAIILDANGSCMIPDRVCEMNTIALYVLGANGDTRIRTNNIYIRQV